MCYDYLWPDGMDAKVEPSNNTELPASPALAVAGGVAANSAIRARLETACAELGIRFLADHLAGDVYFKVRYPGHNLRRALVQFKLAESIEANSVHGSDSLENAGIEIAQFFTDADIVG